VRDCRPDDIGISVSYPLPGTPFYERVKAQLGAKQNWVDSDDLALMYRGTYHADFYRCLHHVVHAEFRARQAWDVACRQRRSPAPARQLAAGVWNAVRLQLLRRQLAQLARRPQTGAPPVMIPVLSQQAAAIPTEPN
jgi:anaerobic magnesium-protoporphyrin IX monomethyl ester cyclase